VYTTEPTAEVTLTITDANGCQATITKSNISFFNTDFGASITEGCAPLNVEFSDASLNANQWHWTFGDGITSTSQNPGHTYLNNGFYTVTLISNSIEGCSDTMIFNSINVNTTLANFISVNPTNCSPALVTFTDLSIGATSWMWDFGDGSTSVNQNPGHIYNVPGLYTIKLIVTNSVGCSDTLTRIDYITVAGPMANFSASANQSCLQSQIHFTDLSTNAISWDWNFGDGNTSTLQNPSTTYQNTGQYVVSLIVFDLQGCSTNYSLINPIDIKPIPTADFRASDTILCTQVPDSFHNDSQNAISYLWNFGDGTISTFQDPSHTYLNSGVYPITLVATNQFGCSDTKIFNSIIVKKTPQVDFSADVTEGCSPIMVAFSDSSINLQNATYFWDLGNGNTSLTQNSKATFTNPGFYSVSLIITNNTGCSDTLIKTASIEVYDLLPPDKSTILAVSVISNSSAILSWIPSTAHDFSYYKIYKKDVLTGNYISIGTINNSSTVTFLDDNNLNTLINSYCYKIQTVDICGYALALDSLQEHCTINVTAQGISDDIRINWTPYIGASVTSYSIYRMEAASANTTLVATVPFNVLTIFDTTLACPIDYTYRVKANNLNGNLIFSDSDTSIAKPPYNALEHQQMNVVRSTVINGSGVLTEWGTPLLAPEKITGYSIYKSTDNVNFSFITSVLPSTHEFIDNDVDVNTQNYYYKIKALNSCDAAGIESNKSSSVLLKAELVNGTTNLSWTGYDGWNTGVDYYIIEKMNEQGEWEIIKKVNGDILVSESGN
jgi:PKD repeat protein